MTISKQQKILDEQKQQKYRCRFCNKSFSSGRALGGHMRTHETYNEPIRQLGEGSSGAIGPEGASFDGNRLPTSHICEYCREEFCSLKSLSKHCCHGCVGSSEDDDNSNGLLPPSFPRSRTPTPPRALTEEEHLANCLVLLSTARANPVLRNTDAAECSTSESKELIDYVVVLPPSPQPEPEPKPPHVSTPTPPTVRQLFECKTCQKVFTSHQALGGHRASHKNVNGCFATRLEIRPAKMAKYTTITKDESNNRTHQSINQAGPSSENMALAIIPFAETSSQLRPLPKIKPKVHECSVCYRQFPSGQALGGHKRCHRSASSSRGGGDGAAVAAEPLSGVATELQVGNSSTGLVLSTSIITLDLNMPAPIDDFPQFTLAAMYLQPGRENASENALNVNIEEAESREVRLADLSDLIDRNEREGGSKWLQIGFESISDQETRADQS